MYQMNTQKTQIHILDTGEHKLRKTAFVYRMQHEKIYTYQIQRNEDTG